MEKKNEAKDVSQLSINSDWCKQNAENLFQTQDKWVSQNSNADIESSWEYQKYYLMLLNIRHLSKKGPYLRITQHRTCIRRHEKTDESPSLLPQITILDLSERKHFKMKGNVDFSGWGTAAFRAYCAISASPHSQNRTKLGLHYLSTIHISNTTLLKNSISTESHVIYKIHNNVFNKIFTNIT